MKQSVFGERIAHGLLCLAIQSGLFTARHRIRDRSARRASWKVQGAGQDRGHDPAPGEGGGQEGSRQARPGSRDDRAYHCQPARRGGPARRDRLIVEKAPVNVKARYFEDIEVDKIRETPAITVTETHVSLYLGLTREPAAAPATFRPSCTLHVDRARLAGQGAAPGRPGVRGVDWHIVREVRVGDTVHGRSRILSKRPRRDGGFRRRRAFPSSISTARSCSRANSRSSSPSARKVPA